MRFLLAADDVSCLELLAFCRPFTRPGDKLFDDGLRVEQILSAAALFESATEDIGSVVGHGLRCLSSTLRVLDVIQTILQAVGHDEIQEKNAFGRVKQWTCNVVHESLPKFKAELRSFLSALQTRAVSTSRLFTDGDIILESLLFPENSDLVREGITKDLQLFYGILILFIIRAGLKTLLNHSIADFHADTLQTSQDPTFEKNLNCPLYHPILYALGGSKMTFGKYLSMLKTKAALKDSYYLYEHYETAARLMPVSIEAPILEHVAYFLDQPTEAPCADGSAEFRRRAIDASAQLVTLPMA
ncbi:hypothetical protein N7G274_004349 [Stereocaulon virgatum]|uniref:Uncharacterized protein n=1 Tax=Stereocaulon virgatum TaxID=373712 RepID=A0ABR4A9Y9_9LECA